MYQRGPRENAKPVHLVNFNLLVGRGHPKNTSKHTSKPFCSASRKTYSENFDLRPQRLFTPLHSCTNIAENLKHAYLTVHTANFCRIFLLVLKATETVCNNQIIMLTNEQNCYECQKSHVTSRYPGLYPCVCVYNKM